jgi:Asp-tRNA(Asn)/Glu-tRNA(Gln) amidotransferase B subunit
MLKLNAKWKFWNMAAIDQETRLFDPNKMETRSMRSKEEANDYRYFPDPDLLPVIIADEQIEAIKAPCLNCLLHVVNVLSLTLV